MHFFYNIEIITSEFLSLSHLKTIFPSVQLGLPAIFVTITFGDNNICKNCNNRACNACKAHKLLEHLQLSGLQFSDTTLLQCYNYFYAHILYILYDAYYYEGLANFGNPCDTCYSIA